MITVKELITIKVEVLENGLCLVYLSDTYHTGFQGFTKHTWVLYFEVCFEKSPVFMKFSKVLIGKQYFC